MPRRGENIYKRKDGRYEGRYVIGKHANGQTRFGYIYGYQYADVQHRLMEKKLARLQWCASYEKREPTVCEWLQRWMCHDVVSSVKLSTYQTYGNQIKRHILPRLGSYYLSQLTPAILGSFVSELKREGLASSTIKAVYRLLSAAIRAALEEGILKKSPCSKFRIRLDSQTEQRVLSPMEQERIKQTATGADHMPALISLYTGLRLGEICALKWEDISWEAQTLTVRRTVQRVQCSPYALCDTKTFLMVGTPKSRRSQRVIPLPVFLVERLIQLRAASSSSGYILGTQLRTAEPRTIQRRFAYLMKRLQITDLRFMQSSNAF